LFDLFSRSFKSATKMTFAMWYWKLFIGCLIMKLFGRFTWFTTFAFMSHFSKVYFRSNAACDARFEPRQRGKCDDLSTNYLRAAQELQVHWLFAYV
jgi:hypothetical protein